MKHLFHVLLGSALLCLLFTTGCAQQSLPSEEGGIVGSGTKVDCQQQPKHATCEQLVK